MSTQAPLRADLFNAPAIPTNATLPNGTVGLWQPTVVTLISGQNEAVLVDTLYTPEQGYLTQRFPGASVVSTTSSISHMATPEFQASWNDLFPVQITTESFQILAKPLQDNKFTLDGHTTFLHVPSLGMIVAGYIVYNDVHMWMTESPAQSQRDAWIRSLGVLESYKPAVVVASHHRPGAVDGPWNVRASMEYIGTFSRLVRESSSAKELYDKVLLAYPRRIGTLVLWTGCKAVFPDDVGV
ncbi:Metallo-hydrolase/oxidoreductase [Aspergillus avenaceus]|uniref:Metallo-hydrolase/oxidoreductase n=1 Tax=Aspergillus avenaceus TaxID=36643 RepID=A0A5N6TJ42_ASPAV|nr:Metallo-hydrolase/oxidoreductase [Aspergillus avenaceus]